jgi:hypothetical protein
MKLQSLAACILLTTFFVSRPASAEFTKILTNCSFSQDEAPSETYIQIRKTFLSLVGVNDPNIQNKYTALLLKGGSAIKKLVVKRSPLLPEEPKGEVVLYDNNGFALKIDLTSLNQEGDYHGTFNSKSVTCTAPMDGRW